MKTNTMQSLKVAGAWLKAAIILAITGAVFCCVHYGQGATLELVNEDEGVFAPRVTRAQWKTMNATNTDAVADESLKKARAHFGRAKAANAGQPFTGFVFGQPGVRASSAPRLGSPSLPQNRSNTMMANGGAQVSNNRQTTPSDFWPIPDYGLRSGDYVVTDFPSWMGTTNTTHVNERGNRIIISYAFPYPASNIWLRVTSTDTNIGTAWVNVGLSSSNGATLLFGLTRIGIWTGPDRKLDSFPDPTIGTWVQGGDDVVYTSGEDPTQVPWDWAYAYGAAAMVGITHPSGYETVNGQFATNHQTFTAELFQGGTNGTRIADQTVEQELVPVQIAAVYEGGALKHFLLSAPHGQPTIPHYLHYQDVVGGPWLLYSEHPIFPYGSPRVVPNVGQQRYFRVKVGSR